MSRFTGFRDFCNNTNFNELRQQKRMLISLRVLITEPERLSTRELDMVQNDAEDAIEGLLNFLDELQDLAKDIYNIKEA